MAQRTCDDEDLTMSQEDWDSEDEVMKECLVKGYFQDKDKGSEALARTQVYLSKTKLRSTGEYLAIYIVKVQ